jgi:hypothetical protein
MVMPKAYQRQLETPPFSIDGAGRFLGTTRIIWRGCFMPETRESANLIAEHGYSSFPATEIEALVCRYNRRKNNQYALGMQPDPSEPG